MKIECSRRNVPQGKMDFWLSAENEDDIRVIEELRRFDGGQISLGTSIPTIPSDEAKHYKNWQASMTLRCRG